MKPSELRVPLVFVDTNVFFPVRLADLVLSSVDDGLFDLCVSEDLLDEIERVLVGRKGLSPDKARVFRDAAEANAAAMTLRESYMAVAAGLTGPDPDDLVHLAAAIVLGADMIVTDNTRDFITAKLPNQVVAPLVLRTICEFAHLR